MNRIEFSRSRNNLNSQTSWDGLWNNFCTKEFIGEFFHNSRRPKDKKENQFIRQLKHLNSRCTTHEHFTKNELLVRLIHGPQQKEIYNDLVIRHISNWDDVIANFIQIEDNLMIKIDKVLLETNFISLVALNHDLITI